jgi:iron complex outermembrane receptor protein
MGDWSFSKIQQEQASLGYKFETRLDDDWTLRQNLRYSKISLDRSAVWFDSLDEDGHTVNRVARTWNEPLRQTAVDTSVQGKLRTANTEHTVLLGLDWNRLKGKSQRFIGDAPTLDLNQPVYGQTVPTPTTPMRDYQQTTEQTGIYLQDQIKWLDRWVFTLGARQDRVSSITDDTLNSSRSEQHDDAFSGRAAITYLAGQGVAPYLSYTESFLPNSGVDAQNLPFKPSRGKQVEAGVKFQPEGSRTLYTAAVFDLRKTNVVTYDPMTFEGRQVGRQRSRGLELEAKGELLPGLNATASYTRTATRVLQSADPDEMGKDLPLVPDQSAALWLDYLLGNGVGFGAGARYVGRRANDEYNTTFQGGATVFDAAVHYETGGWRLALNVSNLLNKEYFSICYHGECYRAAERAATLSAKYRF